MNRVAGESQARVTEAKSTYYFLRPPQIQEYLAHLSCASLWVRRAESIENEFRAVVWTSGEAATHDSLADCCEIGVSHLPNYLLECRNGGRQITRLQSQEDGDGTSM